MNKIKTGIPGLDSILKGGLDQNSSLLVCGGPGTGKTILALQFIYEGAKNNEAGLFITAEESIKSLRYHANNLGFDIGKYEKKGLINIIEQNVAFSKIASIQAPLDLIKKNKIKRVAIDSLILFELIYPKEGNEFRRGLARFIKDMKNSDVILLATSERAITSLDSFVYKDEDFLFDGLIIATRIRKGASFERVVNVVKVRGQDHLLDVFPLIIGKGGVKILTKQLPFSLIEQDIRRK